MTIHYNVKLTNGALDGSTNMALGGNNTVELAQASGDNRSLLYQLEGNFGAIRPRQDIELAEVALGSGSNPLDIIQRASASRAVRQGVPAIDDFLMTHFEFDSPDANAPTVVVVNNVTGIVYEDLSSLLVPTGANEWALRQARIIPTGHEVQVTHPTSPDNFQISASFEPLDGPDAMAALFSGGGVVDLPPVVGEAHTLDPTGGLPLNFVSAPVALPAPGPASYLADFNTLRFTASGNLALRTLLDNPPGGTLAINGFTVIPSSTADMDVVRVDFDCSLHQQGDVYELVFTNDEGGQAAITISAPIA